MPIPGHVPQLERLTPNLEDLKELFHQAITVGARFKADESAYHQRATATQLRDLLVRDLPQTGTDLTGLIEEFEAEILPWCRNEASPRFLGFADTGDDPGALIGELLATFTQQNLINQGFDSPGATFIDVSVLRWLRHLLGYPNPPVSAISSVWDVGGIITPGGTTSNTVAMMLARERFRLGTMHAGIKSDHDMVVLVPAGIGHYSIKSALSWIGLGDATVEVATTSFRYDLPSLATALAEHRERIGAVVVYAGDSRTQTVDHLDTVADLVRDHAPHAWLHADACWGLAAACDPHLSSLLAGIADYDSITVELHEPDLTAVAFVYLPRGVRPGRASDRDVEHVNRVNKAIHDTLLDEGTWFLHQFGLPDDEGHLRRGALIRPLRFLAGNTRVTATHLREALKTVIALGRTHEENL
jgi:L-2,4-diaminobutyrate decarboxylase